MSKIFHEFQVFDESENSKINFVIQEVPEDRFQDFIDFMVKYFVTGAPLNEFKGLAEYPETVELYRKNYFDQLKENSSLICFKKGCKDIVAVNLMTIKNRNDPKQEVSVKYPQPYQDILNIVEYSKSKFCAFDHYQVEKILCCAGMAVHPDYRGRGIATELFKARDPLLRYLGLVVTTAKCSGLGSQIAADRAGYQCQLVLEYEKLNEIHPGLPFKGVKYKYFKVMCYNIK